MPNWTGGHVLPIALKLLMFRANAHQPPRRSRAKNSILRLRHSDLTADKTHLAFLSDRALCRGVGSSCSAIYRGRSCWYLPVAPQPARNGYSVIAARRARANMSDIYKHPEEYDLEHRGDDEDTGFYLQLVRRLQPQRLLELGCGTGRITLPLARDDAKRPFAIVGLDSEAEMLNKARQSLAQAEPETRQRLTYIQADMLAWQSDVLFDLIIIPCGSLSHLLELGDQIMLFKQCYSNLNTGGRFVVEVSMPNLATYADSFRVPPRTIVEIDLDNLDHRDGTRLIRRKTTSYSSHQQLAEITFLYEKYENGRGVENYIDDFASHVFFPRELALLFIHAGFAIEQALGDYRGRELQAQSPLIIVIGRKD